MEIKTKLIEIRLKQYTTISDLVGLNEELEDKLDESIITSRLELKNFRSEIKIDKKDMKLFQEITKKYDSISWVVIDWW